MDAETSQTQALLLEVLDHQKKLLAQSARLMELQRQEHAQLREQLEQAETALRETAHGLAEGGRRFADEALVRIDGEGRRLLADGLARPLDLARQEAEAVAQALVRARASASRELNAALRAQALAGWKSLAFLALGGAFLVAGSTAWAWHQRAQARLYAVEADLGRRLAQADLVKCGDGLCAAVGPALAAQAGPGGYRQVLRRDRTERR